MTNQIFIAKDVFVNEEFIRDTNDEGSKIISFAHKNKADDFHIEVEPTHSSEESENEPKIQIDDTRDSENTNKTDKYNLRKRDSIKRPSKYKACFTLFDEPESLQQIVSGENSTDWKF